MAGYWLSEVTSMQVVGLHEVVWSRQASGSLGWHAASNLVGSQRWHGVGRLVDSMKRWHGAGKVVGSMRRWHGAGRLWSWWAL